MSIYSNVKIVMNIQHAHCGLVGQNRSARKAPFIATSKAAYGLCLDQLGGHVELPWLMRKYDVIHKTGSTQRIATPSEEDRATAIGDMHTNW